MRKGQMPKARILLVDDHSLMRKGLRALLEHEAGFSVVGEAGDGAEALQQLQALSPDVIVMDVNMPGGMGGIEATRRILARQPGAKIVTLSMHGDKSFVDEMLKAGAGAYLLKDSAPEDLVRAIRAVLRGECFLSPPILGTVVSGYRESVKGASAPPFILQTKLHRPALPPDLVMRAGMLDRLDAGRALPLTLVSAPAGYGKSLLIASWLERVSSPSAWLALDRDDSDVRRFASYVVAAIRRAFPDACEGTLGLVTGASEPPVAALAAGLANELDNLPQPVILVLDDYHHVQADSAVNELLQQVLTRPPATLHLVVVSRRDPPLPLSRMRSRGHVNEIRMRDLQFSAEEARVLLDAASGRALPDEAVARLDRELEGWVAGLRLVAVSLRRAPDSAATLARLRGGVQQAQQYLIQEVVEGQPARVREWLLKCAILDRFCAPLCAAMIEPPGEPPADASLEAETFLGTLSGENLFVSPLDSDGTWFRFHPLFQDLLAAELKRTVSPAQVAALHGRAGRWFESEDLPDEAIRHALAAGDVGHAAVVIEKHSHATIRDGDLYMAARWLSLLPPEAVQGRVELLRADAWRQYYGPESRSLPGTLDRLEHLAGADRSSSLSADVAALRAWCALLDNDGVRALEHAERGLALAASPEDAPARSLAETMFGLAGHMEGQRERVSRVLTRRLVDASVHDPRGEINLSQTLALMSYVAADPPGAGALIDRARRAANAAGLAHMLPASDYLDGLFLLQRGELDQALPLLGYAKQGRSLHQVRSVVDAMCAQVQVCQALGRTEESLESLGALESFVRDTRPSCSQLAEACAVRRALLAGETEAAAGWLKASPAPAAEAMLWWFEVPAVTWCRALIAQGTPVLLREAQARLREHAAMNESRRNACQLVVILGLLAIACNSLGEHDESAVTLEQALALAEPAGFVYPFIEAGAPMVTLLHGLGEEHHRFVDQVFQAIDSTAVPPSGVRPPIAGPAAQARSAEGGVIAVLTNRELDILELLAERLQNKEIADRLSIAPETVNYHLKHIYQKLNVGGRRQAVTAALDSGLLQGRPQGSAGAPPAARDAREPTRGRRQDPD